MDIPSPELPPDHPGLDDECAIYVETVIAVVWEFFEDAGWTEDEFDRALLVEVKRNASFEE